MVVYGESDQMPGLVVDRYGDVLAVQILTLGMETRAELVREALEQRARAARGVGAPRRLAAAHARGPAARAASGGGAKCPDRIEVDVSGFTRRGPIS